MNSREALALLENLAYCPVDARMEKSWGQRNGSVEALLAKFIEAGLLREATAAQKLDFKFKLAELRPLLAQRGVTTTGKKSTLVERLIENYTPAEIDLLVAGLRLYRPTSHGEERIRGLRDARRAARDEEDRGRREVEDKVLALLRGSDVAGAGRVVADYEAGRSRPRGFGVDWRNGMPQCELEVAGRILGHPIADLPIEDEKRREVGCALALCHMLGEPCHAVATRLLDALGGTFSCPELDGFLRSAPCGEFVRGMDPDNPRDLALVYGHTRIHEAVCAVSLKHIVESPGRSGGVEFLPATESGCRICNHGQRRYRWSEIPKMPRIPRHWGCRCTFITWHE